MYNGRQGTLLKQGLGYCIDLGTIENSGITKNEGYVELVGADVNAVFISPEERLITETGAAGVAGLAHGKEKIAPSGVEVHNGCNRDKPALCRNVEIASRVAEESRKKIGA